MVFDLEPWYVKSKHNKNKNINVLAVAKQTSIEPVQGSGSAENAVTPLLVARIFPGQRLVLMLKKSFEVFQQKHRLSDRV